MWWHMVVFVWGILEAFENYMLGIWQGSVVNLECVHHMDS